MLTKLWHFYHLIFMQTAQKNALFHKGLVYHEIFLEIFCKKKRLDSEAYHCALAQYNCRRQYHSPQAINSLLRKEYHCAPRRNKLLALQGISLRPTAQYHALRGKAYHSPKAHLRFGRISRKKASISARLFSILGVSQSYQ
jgi:hypothetical protein